MSSVSAIDFTLLLFGASCVISVIAFCAVYLKDHSEKVPRQFLDKLLSVITIFTDDSELDRQQQLKEPLALAKEQIKQENFDKAVLILSEYLKDHPLDKEAQELLEHAVMWS